MLEDASARLIGQVERITYQNDENGYTIAKVAVDGELELVTVVGNLCGPMLGEILDMQGRWGVHPTYGSQFKVASFKAIAPASLEGIERYLASGVIKGIGPSMAAKIVESFGVETLDVLEHEPYRLPSIPGIGKRKAEAIRLAWSDTKDVRQVMIFLQSYEVSPAYAARIYNTYGRDAINLITENPYRVAMDIPGIGFMMADRIAQNLGFERNSEQRAEAGILYVLNQLNLEGHVYYPQAELVSRSCEILKVDETIVLGALDELNVKRLIMVDHVDKRDVIYLSRFYRYEEGIAASLLSIHNTPKFLPPFDVDYAIEQVQAGLSFELAEKQQEAVRMAVSSGVSVISGGPGTGKTTIMLAILNILHAQHATIQLAAPTGRAAKRLGEAAGHEASTIHRLLEYTLSEGFKRGPDNPLEADFIVVDEASMVDTSLMYYLLRAIPSSSSLILVGDVDQLPSVGAGMVLADIINSGEIPVVILDEIFRQAGESMIISNAHLINHGMMPDLSQSVDTDFFFINREDPEAVLETVLALATENIPQRFALDPIKDIQILSPIHRGPVGVGSLNDSLQRMLNREKREVLINQRAFKLHDKVMQLRNDYMKEVYNGDIGRVVHISSADQEVVISYDGRDVVYDFNEMEDVALAYAVTVHKSQGSEYPAVIIPIVTQHYMMLQRNLIYTAISRGKRLVVMVGSKRALAMAVKNDRTQQRYTNLQGRIRSCGKGEF